MTTHHEQTNDHSTLRTRPRASAYLVDEQGCIVAVNSLAERMLGRRAEELVGQDAHELLHRGAQGQPLHVSQCAMRQAFHAGHPAQGDDDYFAHADGSVLPVSWFIAPYAVDGRNVGTLVLFHPRPQASATGPHPERTAEPLSELERLALLAETTTRLTSTLNVDEALHRLVELVLPRLADWAVIDLITEHDEVWRTAVVHSEEERLVPYEELQGPMPPVPEHSAMPLSRALRGVASALVEPDVYDRPRTPASPSSSAVCSTPPASGRPSSFPSAGPGRFWEPSRSAGRRNRGTSPPRTCL